MLFLAQYFHVNCFNFPKYFWGLCCLVLSIIKIIHLEPPPQKVLHGLFQSSNMPGDATAGDADLGQTRCPQPLCNLGAVQGRSYVGKPTTKKKQHHADQLHFFYFFLLFGVRKKQRFGVEKAAICSEQPRFVSWPFSYMKVALVSK